MRIAGRTALITGAASGIGRELALVLAERGVAKTLLLDRDEAGLRETGDQVSARGAVAVIRRTDISDLADLAGAYADAATHGYDICFNNAGIILGLPNYPEAADARIDLVIRTDLTAVVLGTKYAIQHMRGRGGGVIINTGSEAAVIPMFENIPYRVAKTGVHYLTECCRPLAEENIRVNAFHPGGVDTPMTRNLGGEGQPTPQWALERMAKHSLWPVRYIAEQVTGLVEDDSRAGENLVLRNQPNPA